MRRKTQYSLVLSSDDHVALQRLLLTEDGCENFAVLFCGLAADAAWQNWLCREIMPAPPSAYRERLAYHLEITPAFLNRVVDHALSTGLSPIIVHSHPGVEYARYSPSDDLGEARLLPVLQQLLPGHFPASLLLSRGGMTARQMAGGRFVPFERIDLRGCDSRILTDRPGSNRPAATDEFERIVRAIGCDGHALLESLRVAVVGAGGTGSAVVEQLVRIGVGDLVLVDPDTLERSNVPRVWGSTSDDADRGHLKVGVLARHLKGIRPEATVRTIGDSVIRQRVLWQLRDRDLLFACTDNHLSRAVLNRFAHQYLVPVVDMGIRLDARTGTVTAVGGRVSLVGSGLTCLRCSGHIDPEQVRAEALPPGEREALAREGYIQGIPNLEPSVISLNTTIASMAVTSGLGLFVNLVGRRPPLDLVYDSTNSSLLSISQRHDEACDVCTAHGGLKGLGDSQIVSAYD